MTTTVVENENFQAATGVEEAGLSERPPLLGWGRKRRSPAPSFHNAVAASDESSLAPSPPPSPSSQRGRASRNGQNRDSRSSRNSEEENARRRSAITGVELNLVNSGSVARDHLASERTYLAYVRTSLGLASAGVALIQFLHLGHGTRVYAVPLGVVTILTAIVVLYVGTKRFFLVQKALVLGYYPVSAVEVGAISFVLGAIVTVTFAVILAGGVK